MYYTPISPRCSHVLLVSGVIYGVMIFPVPFGARYSDLVVAIARWIKAVVLLFLICLFYGPIIPHYWAADTLF